MTAAVLPLAITLHFPVQVGSGKNAKEEEEEEEEEERRQW